MSLLAYSSIPNDTINGIVGKYKFLLPCSGNRQEAKIAFTEGGKNFHNLHTVNTNFDIIRVLRKKALHWQFLLAQ